ncbi:hypothetical protein EC844_13016 [Acinetobacter calcoaceticus]|uniref:Carboxypeptidase regulatory-like domain-containing protein n=1 Tax=Acinetobacter calcoaceticus TaxID=471 RepID=A0A4R1XD20_ACICA|nr:hypothetical protein EC844_13016 [Acinetobacter calcoaceticus]
MRIVILIILAILITSCSSKKMYLKPAVKGQLIDNSSKLPIKEKGYLSTVFAKDGSSYFSTDKNGYFYIDVPTTKKISHRNYRSIPALIYINVEGYKRTNYDFSGIPRVPPNVDKYTKSEVDVGTIYLEPNTE